MFAEEFLVDGAQALHVDLDGIEVQQRYAELVGCSDRYGA